MKSQEIRKNFLNYFEKNNHKIYDSSSLIPENDSTLLFTIAGMVQFKPMFAGLINTDNKRAASIQKCLRVVDIEEVGNSPFHDTFFEMLGNFSFGDYFQKDAIFYAWDFLTRELAIDKDRLYITVHKDDKSAYDIWHKDMNISSDRIILMSDKTNFWGPAGGTGACGPSSEIFYDFGKELADRENCSIHNDCKRYIEIWNLVFPQFNQDKDGNRHTLKNKGVDTGMGLERLAALIQDKKTIFATDLFTPIIEHIVNEYNIDYEKHYSYINSIADHIRALTFVIADGVLPSNEGRGYVVRRVLRRAVRLAYKMGIEKEFLYKTSNIVIDIMNEQYPTLKKQSDKIATIIKSEEKRFFSIIGQGISLYNFYKKDIKDKIPADILFKLHDTYGFPIDLLKQMADEDNLLIDETGFNKLLESAKEKSRKKAKFIQKEKKEWTIFNDSISIFTGYEQLETVSKPFMYRKSENDTVEILFKKTPFYAESGGQIGDSGKIYNDDFLMEVHNTYKSNFGNIMFGKIIKGKINKDTDYILHIDEERRKLVERNHTATHILQSVLRDVLGDHVHQQGSYVSYDKLRFDFVHYSSISREEIIAIEKKINDIIFDSINIKKSTMDYDNAIGIGAMALFTEKYDREVRVVEIPGKSVELCGGTHVDNTSQIQIFKIISESSVAAGIRRIEAITSKYCYDFINKQLDILDSAKIMIGVKKNNEIKKRLKKIIDDNNRMNKKINELKREQIKTIAYKLNNKIITHNNKKIIFHIFEDETIEFSDLKEIMDIIKSENREIMGLLGIKKGQRINILVFIQNYNNNANEIIKSIMKDINGKGGGNKTMASGNAQIPNNIEQFKQSVIEKFNV